VDNQVTANESKEDQFDVDSNVDAFLEKADEVPSYNLDPLVYWFQNLRSQNSTATPEWKEFEQKVNKRLEDKKLLPRLHLLSDVKETLNLQSIVSSGHILLDKNHNYYMSMNELKAASRSGANFLTKEFYELGHLERQLGHSDVSAASRKGADFMGKVYRYKSRVDDRGRISPGHLDNHFRYKLAQLSVDWGLLNFEKLDGNKNGFVTENELARFEARKVGRYYSSDDLYELGRAGNFEYVMAHSLGRIRFHAIQKVSNDEWGLENDGITKKDLEKFRAIFPFTYRTHQREFWPEVK